MCGRFAQAASPAALVQELGLSEAPALTPRYNVAPSQPVAIVLPGPVLGTAFWGLPVGPRRQLLARAETVEKLGAFREAFRQGRCLVPVTGFFEWQGEGRRRRPWLIRRSDGAPFTIGAIRDGENLALLTTAAGAVVAPIHDRMPLWIEPADRALWLDPAAPLPAIRGLLTPASTLGFLAHPVSRRVNNPAHDEPALLEPAEEEQGELF